MNVRSLSGLDVRDLSDVLMRTTHLHSKLSGARIVVTGATGWFGTWLLDALVAIDRAARLDLRLVAVSRRPEAFAARHPRLHAAPAIEWLRADVRDPILDVAGPITHVIHGATDASSALNAGDPQQMFDTIVDGTRHVLRIAARQEDARTLLIGSGAVYGVQSPDVERLCEDHPLASNPLDAASAYAEGKRVAEHLAAICHGVEGLHVTIARCFAFVGPHIPVDAHFAVGNFVRDAVDGDAIRVTGDGTPLRSYLYASDLVVWLLTILVEGRALRPYNVGSDESVSIRDLARLCADAGGSGADVIVEGRPGGRDYVPDTTRARTELGLGVHVSLHDAIARTTAWRRRQCVPVSA